jgi:ATP-dependent Clp protease ATP-binding subunit ClpA
MGTRRFRFLSYGPDSTDKSSFSDNKAKQAAMERVQGLGIEQEDLRYKLEEAESGTCTLNVDELEKNNDPITAKMVAKSASYHTFIPAAEALTSSEMLHVLGRLGTVVNNVYSTIIVLVHNILIKVVGQPEAVEAVANTVQCMWAGLKNPRRPIASFLFGGPSGSGKTLLVKEVSS